MLEISFFSRPLVLSDYVVIVSKDALWGTGRYPKKRRLWNIFLFIFFDVLMEVITLGILIIWISVFPSISRVLIVDIHRRGCQWN